MYSIKPPAKSHVSLRDLFDRETLAATRLRYDAHRSIYATGDSDDSLYTIDAGQVKIIMSSVEGKDCLLAVYGVGDVFSESCFTDSNRRVETATAMEYTVVRRASRRDFLAEVNRASALDALLRHLAVRNEEREIAVFDLIINGSEQRLAKTLLSVAEKLGVPEGAFLRLGDRISHEELSQMVGTTRPRITAFMQRFRTLGLIETRGRSLSVNRERMKAFLTGE